MKDWRTEREHLLVALEREPKPEDRAEAAELLCELAHDAPAAAREELIPVVARLIADAQPLVRSAGLALASQVLPADEAYALFVRHVSDAAPRVRAEATGRLADLARPDARGALAAALEDQNPSVRFEAARGMAALQHSAGFDVLVAALKDADLRFRALAALAELEDARAVPHVRSVLRGWLTPHFDRTQAAGVLIRLGDPEGEGEQHLLSRAAKKWTEDRPMALELLGEVKAKAALETLSRVLRTPGDLCRGPAARGLGRLGTPAALEALRAALPDADDDLKVDIAEALLLIGTDDSRALAAGIRVRSTEAQGELDAILGS